MHNHENVMCYCDAWIFKGIHLLKGSAILWPAKNCTSPVQSHALSLDAKYIFEEINKEYTVKSCVVRNKTNTGIITKPINNSDYWYDIQALLNPKMFLILKTVFVPMYCLMQCLMTISLDWSIIRPSLWRTLQVLQKGEKSIIIYYKFSNCTMWLFDLFLCTIIFFMFIYLKFKKGSRTGSQDIWWY